MFVLAEAGPLKAKATRPSSPGYPNTLIGIEKFSNIDDTGVQFNQVRSALKLMRFAIMSYPRDPLIPLGKSNFEQPISAR